MKPGCRPVKVSRLRPGPALPACRRAGILAVLTLICLAYLFTRITTIQALEQNPEKFPVALPYISKNWPVLLEDRLLISEVCFDPFGPEPDGEWIEVYNPGSKLLDLSAHKIGDAANREDKEGMLHFPPGTILMPGKTLVIANRADVFHAVYGWYPDFEMNDSIQTVTTMSRYLTWAGRYVELTNSADEVVILDGEDKVVDAVSWGSSSFAFNPPVARPPEGYSIERYPPYQDTDSAQDWRARSNPNPGEVDRRMPTLTPTRLPTATLSPPPTNTALPFPTLTPTHTPSFTPLPTSFTLALLVSEVLYDPFGVEPDHEWIEIYNPSGQRIWLGGFKVGDEEERGGSEGMLAFPPGAFIEPGQALVVANRASNFFQTYGFKPDYEMIDSDPSVPNMLKYLDWSSGNVNLANNPPHDEVLILDGQDGLVDAVSWGSSVWAFNPGAMPAPEGSSIERYPPDVDTDSALDWRVQNVPNPGLVHHPTPTPTATPTPTLTPGQTQTRYPRPSPTATDTAEPTDENTPTPLPTLVLVINEIHADPDGNEGDANGDGILHPQDDEFVEIVNAGSTGVDLSGWTLTSSGLTRHIFPESTMLEPGCGLVVFGGGNPQGEFGGSIVQVALSGTLDLANNGDTVVIAGPDGYPVFSYTYGPEGGFQQSLTRYPDVTGPDPLILHTLAPGSEGALFSPGTQVDGQPFAGCP
jgi:hypothetical protein